MKDSATPLSLSADFPSPSLDEWREAATRELRGTPLEKLDWRPLEGLSVRPFLRREDVADLPHLGPPGAPPYARGVEAPLATARRWQNAQECALPSPEQVNSALRDGLAKGQTAIRLLLDEAVERGLDADSSEAAAMVGRGGCTLTSINGLRVALADLDLHRHPLTIKAGAAALPALGLLGALAAERGESLRDVEGAVGGDPHVVWLRCGSLPLSFDDFDRLEEAAVAWTRQRAPKIRPLIASAHLYAEAGASLVDELAFTLAGAAERLRALIGLGASADEAAAAFAFTVPVSANVLLEIAKLRAARVLWALIVKTFGGEDPAASKMWLHARTSGHMMTATDAHSNLIRTSVASFAAVAGGCQSLGVEPFDVARGRPSELSQRLARNQQILLEEEAHLGRVADPLGGAYAVEALTDAMGRAVWAVIQEIEGAGGFRAAARDGLLEARITASAKKRLERLASRRDSIIGVTNYVKLEEPAPRDRRDNREAYIAERRRRVARLRAMRSPARVRDLLRALRQARGVELVDRVIEAAAEGATIGEMMTAFGAGGERPAVSPLERRRAAQPFEDLADRAAASHTRTGRRPRALLLLLGPPAMRRARADFSTSFLAAGGFTVTEPQPFESVEEALRTAADDPARVIVICSDDASYPQIAPAIAQGLKAQRPEARVIVAGHPEAVVEELRAAGVDGFIHLNADQLATLEQLQSFAGVEASQ